MDDSSIITPRLGLDGAFIQFNYRNAINPVKRLDKKEWEDVLDAMQQAGSLSCKGCSMMKIPT